MTTFKDLLSSFDHIVLDGASGTQLFERGLSAGDPPELWNLERPAEIKSLYRSYMEAGSQIFMSNTFGANRFRLALHNKQNLVSEINKAAIELGRQAIDEVRQNNPELKLAVAGSMGPSGELLEPLGTLNPKECMAGFAEQASALTVAGADLLWFETMSSLEEAESAVLGAREVSDLPICLTMSFDTAGHTMMGVDGLAVAELAVELNLSAVGANCGNNLADTEKALAQMRSVDENLILISKANAGIPQWRGAELVYSATPEIMAEHALNLKRLGVHLIGACCGSGPDHIKAMRHSLESS